MKGFAELTSINVALKNFFEKVHIEKLESEVVPVSATLGRVLSKDFFCPRDLPSFDRSAVDGFAVIAEDVFGASESNPVVLSVIGRLDIGRITEQVLRRGEAMQIATGAQLPKGADAAVMVEFTEVTGSGKVEVSRSIAPYENISIKGEDVKEGQLILKAGTFLQPQDIGILVALGITDVEVRRKPIVAIISTGNELVELGSEIQLGKIVDSNRPTLLSLVKISGAKSVDLGIVTDDPEKINEKIKLGLSLADLMLVSGGTSVGERDFLPNVVNKLGTPGVIVHGIAMRPGRPVALCAIGSKPIVLLPGFPVAAMIAYDVFVEPIILSMLGALTRRYERQTVTASALRRVPSSSGIRSFVRVFVMRRMGRIVFEPIRSTGSGVISSMVKANGMLVIPEDKEGVEEGEVVEIILLRPIDGASE